MLANTSTRGKLYYVKPKKGHVTESCWTGTIESVLDVWMPRGREILLRTPTVHKYGAGHEGCQIVSFLINYSTAKLPSNLSSPGN